MRLPCFRKWKILFVLVTFITSTFLLIYGALQWWYCEQVSFSSLSKRVILVDDLLEHSANSRDTQSHRDTETQSHRDTETQSHRDTETQSRRAEISKQSSVAVVVERSHEEDVINHVNVDSDSDSAGAYNMGHSDHEDEISSNLELEITDTVNLLESDKGEEGLTLNRPATEPEPSEETKSLDEQLLENPASIHSEMNHPPSLVDISTMDWHTFTLKQIDEIYAYNKKTIEETLLKRKKKMLSVCQSINNKSFYRPYLFHFSTLKLSWCPTYKAGSTTWKDYLVNRFVDPNLSHPGLEKLWDFKLSEVSGHWPDGKKKYRKEEENTIRFTVVRHPIVRIISYWKMAQDCGEFVRVSMHKDILLARQLPDRTQEEKFKGEIDKYFHWCEEQVKGNDLPRPIASIDNPYLNPPHITFPELVDKMKTQRERLKTGDWEGHWAPASEWCDVCTHKMDYVAKLENEPWELWYLLDTLGLWEDRTQFLSIKNTASSTGKPSAETEMEGFTSQLTVQQITFLNSFFDNDFRMFEYDQIPL